MGLDFFSIESDESLYDANIKDLLSRRILILNEGIDDNILDSYITHIIRWNIEDVNIPVEKEKRLLL